VGHYGKANKYCGKFRGSDMFPSPGPAFCRLQCRKAGSAMQSKNSERKSQVSCTVQVQRLMCMTVTPTS